MQIRITKSRVAMAALFVLAGVGLGSLLSPLVGTALATVGQTVNISDRSGSAFFAKVSSDGKLAVGDGSGPLTVDGTLSDRPASPALPWRAKEEIQSTSSPSLGRVRRQSTSPASLSRRTLRPETACRSTCTAPRWRAAPRAAPTRRPRDALGHFRCGRRRHAAVLHLSDAAAMEATREQESVPACGRIFTNWRRADERRRLLRRLTNIRSRRTFAARLLPKKSARVESLRTMTPSNDALVPRVMKRYAQAICGRGLACHAQSRHASSHPHWKEDRC